MSKTLLTAGMAVILTASHMYVASTPFSTPTPLMALDVLFALSLLCFVLLISAAVGLRFLRLVYLASIADGRAILPSSGIGVGVIAYVVLLELK